MAKRKRGDKKSKSRRVSRKLGVILSILLILWAGIGDWFVHHPRKWLDHVTESWPSIVTEPLFKIGNPIADLTDGLDLTGHDAVYEYDTEAPSGQVFFAGAPRRTGNPAPSDIRIVSRGEFTIGWSDSLRHPVWVAYHVTPKSNFEIDKRPSFTRDREIAGAPSPTEYTKSGYDRGHMAPNHAIASRYGEAAQKLTFMMSNIAPQTPALNRGVWRDVEHRIADFWTARFGEIWVIVGCISPESEGQIRIGKNVDVPSHYYQVVVAQEGMDVRVLSVLFPQNIGWDAWAARNIVSVDELEALTGLDFNPELPEFIQVPMESDLPSRLWPVRKRDIFSQVFLRYAY